MCWCLVSSRWTWVAVYLFAWGSCLETENSSVLNFITVHVSCVTQPDGRMDGISRGWKTYWNPFAFHVPSESPHFLRHFRTRKSTLSSNEMAAAQRNLEIGSGLPVTQSRNTLYFFLFKHSLPLYISNCLVIVFCLSLLNCMHREGRGPVCHPHHCRPRSLCFQHLALKDINKYLLDFQWNDDHLFKQTVIGYLLWTNCSRPRFHKIRL